MKNTITDKQFINSYRSAGLWFVALYMEAFILRIDELRGDVLKTKLVEEIYDNGENTFDKDIGGTRTRVNALYRIIKAGRINEVLKLASNSIKLNKDFPEAAKEASYLLKRIETGEFKVSVGGN